jgi:hypothetical protein
VLEYGRRIGSQGVRRELRDRTAWVREAARQLLGLSPAPDAGLRALAEGRVMAELFKGVQAGDVPLTRAVLLGAGNVLL